MTPSYNSLAVAVIVGASSVGTSSAAAAPARPPFNPFTLARALEAPNAEDNPGIRRRNEVLKRLRDNRVLPPGHQKKRSPFETDPDGNRGHGNDPDGHDEQNPGRGRPPTRS